MELRCPCCGRLWYTEDYKDIEWITSLKFPICRSCNEKFGDPKV